MAPRGIEFLLDKYVLTDIRLRFATHRGSGKMALIPENTESAFENGCSNGFSIHELDVRLSEDGIPVIFHGPLLQKNTSGVGKVENRKFNYLKSLDWGNYTKKLPNSTDQKHISILTMEDYLKIFGHRCYTNIEIKRDVFNFKNGLEESVIALVRKYKLEKKVFFSSFNWISLYKIKKYAPDIAIGVLVSNRWYTFFWLPFLLKNIQPDFVHPQASFLTKSRVKKWKNKGYNVIIWGENSYEKIKTFFQWGLDIAIVDDLSLPKKFEQDVSLFK